MGRTVLFLAESLGSVGQRPIESSAGIGRRPLPATSPMILRRHPRLAVALAAGLVAFAAAIEVPIFGTQAALVISNIGQIIAPGLAAVACLRAGRRSVERSHARAWALFGASSASWATGQAIWTYYALSHAAAPYPSLADAGYLLAVPLSLLAVWYLSNGRAVSSRLVAVVDGLLVAGGLLAISWPVVLGPAWRAGGDNALTFALSLAYPVGNLVVASSVLLVIMNGGRRHEAVPVGAIGTAMFLLVGADSLFVLSTVQGTEAAISGADLGWVLGYLVLFLAALSFPARTPCAARPPVDLHHADLKRALLPFTVVSAAMALRFVLVLTGYRVDGFLSGVTGISVVLLLARQLLTVAENQRLTESLEEKIGQLTSREEQLTYQALARPVDRAGQPAAVRRPGRARPGPVSSQR